MALYYYTKQLMSVEENMIMRFSKINKHPITPLQVENVFDLGYMGVKNDFPIVKSVCASI
jgi:hypothetical protein